MLAQDTLLAAVLREPHRLSDLRLPDWDRLIPQARRAALLARLAWLAEGSGTAVATRPGEYLEGARVISLRRAQAVHFEVDRIQAAFEGTQIRVVLLKGTAYEMAGLPNALGRTFSDIDLMVPRENLGTAEKVLGFHGWSGGQHTQYDQRYYRKWMHEIPPLMHIRRQTVIDLHHAILPISSRIYNDPQPLFDNARPLQGFANLHILAPADMVLHSAAHLFTGGEYNNGLRDLADLDSLLRHFSADPNFWTELERRAKTLNLGRPLYYALRYCRAILGTSVPPELQARNAPPFVPLMDALFERALAPEHPSCADRLTGLARWVLYVRGHWLRMPLYLLIPHLFYKAFLADREQDPADRGKDEKDAQG